MKDICLHFLYESPTDNRKATAKWLMDNSEVGVLRKIVQTKYGFVLGFNIGGESYTGGIYVFDSRACAVFAVDVNDRADSFSHAELEAFVPAIARYVDAVCHSRDDSPERRRHSRRRRRARRSSTTAGHPTTIGLAPAVLAVAGLVLQTA